MKFLLATLLVSLSLLTMNAQISVRAEMDTFGIYIGEQVRVRLIAISPTPSTVLFPIHKDTLTAGVECIGQQGMRSTPHDSLSMDGGTLKQLTSYITITSFDSALYTIPPFHILINGEEYATNNLVLKVMSVPVDEAHPDTFFPLRDVLSAPITLNDMLFLLIAALLIALLSHYIYRYFKDSTPHTHQRPKPRKPTLQPISLALHRLQEAGSNVNTQSDKDFETSLTHTLRTFITAQYKFDAHVLTTEQLIAKLSTVPQVPFRVADLVKFARAAITSEERHEHLQLATSFVEAHFADNTANEPESQSTNTQSHPTALPLFIRNYGMLLAAALITHFLLIAVIHFIASNFLSQYIISLFQ